MKMLRLLLNGWCWIWFGTLGLTASEITRGPVVVATSTNAVIRWSTDNTTGSRVYFGTSVHKMDQRAEGETGIEHEVVIKGLQAGQTYHYTVGTARIPLATNSFIAPGFSTLDPAKYRSTVASGPNAKSTTAKTTAPVGVTKAPPTRQIWGNMPALQDHFDRHGEDFGSKDPDDYARQAWEFLQRAKSEGLPAKRDSSGVLRVYDPKSRAFAAYNRDGTAKTYFKPGRRDYFDDQPGDPVDLKSSR